MRSPSRQPGVLEMSTRVEIAIKGLRPAPADAIMMLEFTARSRGMTAEQIGCMMNRIVGQRVDRVSINRWFGGRYPKRMPDALKAMIKACPWFSPGLTHTEPARWGKAAVADRLAEWSRQCETLAMVPATEQTAWRELVVWALAQGQEEWSEAQWLMLALSLVHLADQTVAYPPPGDRYSERDALAMLVFAKHLGVQDKAFLALADAVLGRVHHNLAGSAQTENDSMSHANAGAGCYRRAADLYESLGNTQRLAGVLADHARLASMLQRQANPEAARLAHRAIPLAVDDRERWLTAHLALVMCELVRLSLSKNAAGYEGCHRTLDRSTEGYSNLADLPPLWLHFIHLHRAMIHAFENEQDLSARELGKAGIIGTHQKIRAWESAAKGLSQVIDRPNRMLLAYRRGKAHELLPAS